MDSLIATRLAYLPPLSQENVWKRAHRCKLCRGQALFFDVVDFNKFCSQEDVYGFGHSGVAVFYLRCRSCGFVFTNFFDDWTTADFERYIYNEDYIKVDGEYVSVRPTMVGDSMAEILRGCESARILDYGSGSGVFATRLESHGFQHVTNYDPFSSTRRPTGLFDIITCFEVIEHTTSPIVALSDIRSLLANDGCVIFSQTLQPPDIASIRGNWWYLAPRNGHVSAFTANSLAMLAKATGCVFHLGTGPYAFSRKNRSAFAEVALRRMGDPYFFAYLAAPLADSYSAGTPTWLAAETSPRGAFRWSGASRIPFEWSVSPELSSSGKLIATVPVVDEIEAEFAARCTLSLGAQTVGAQRQSDGSLVFELTVDPQSTGPLVLNTPTLRSPFEQRGVPDDRKLGIAVLVDD